MDTTKVIGDFKKEEIEKDKRQDAEMRRWRKESDKRSAIAGQWKRKLRPATIIDYVRWLEGYIGAGNRPTHYYQYKFPENDFFVAESDFTVTPLYGSCAVQIIVPEGVRVESSNTGHINVYHMDGFKCVGGWIPVYKDIN